MSDDCINANRLEAERLEDLKDGSSLERVLFGVSDDDVLEEKLADALEAAELTDKVIEETDCGRLSEPEPEPEIFTRAVERVNGLLSR